MRSGRIPPGRAVLALPWYGYDWLDRNGKGVTYVEALATATRVGATIARDPNGELTYTYDGRTVFFQDATSFRTKIEWIAARHTGIAGFAAWRVGAEDTNVWNHIAELHASPRKRSRAVR